MAEEYWVSGICDKENIFSVWPVLSVLPTLRPNKQMPVNRPQETVEVVQSVGVKVGFWNSEHRTGPSQKRPVVRQK